MPSESVVVTIVVITFFYRLFVASGLDKPELLDCRRRSRD
jgi:hypothetical protein